MGFMNNQARDGFINWKVLSTDPHQKILSQPLLATLALMIHQYKENPNWLIKIFPGLMKFFTRWFSKDFDRDQDGFPEWDHPHQTGLGESPLYDLWHSNSQFVSVQSLETPSLASLLYLECKNLIFIANAIGNVSEIQFLNDKLDQLRLLIEACWNSEKGRYLYRDFRNHLSGSGNMIGAYINGKHILNKDFIQPQRLVLQISSNNQDARALSISISGRDRKNNFTEKIKLKDLTRASNNSVYTTSHDFLKIYQIHVAGLVKGETVLFQSVDYTQSDISLYLPLWAEVPLSDSTVTGLIDSLVSDYFKPFGMPVSPDSAPYVPLYWVNLIGEGLLKNGQESLAVQLISRIMNAMSQNLQKYGALYEKFHSETGQPLGDKYRLSGLASISLFLKSLGIEKLTSTSISLNGINPYPWPVTIKFRNLSITMHQSDSTITFHNGQVVNVSGPGPHLIYIR